MQNPKTRLLDTFPIEKILRIMDEEDGAIPRFLQSVRPKITQAVRLIVASIRKEGRMIFFGAGTSGRLGIMEAAECPPTFNTPPDLVQAVMAGGRQAVFRSQEGAEDRINEALKEVRKRVRRNDVVIGISASGVTPFVEGALKEAKRIGASTILIACNLKSPFRVDVLIAPRVGAEIISGSTRLKAGTVTKLILNRLTVCSMVQLGKVYGNWMVDLQPRSRKLKARSKRMVKILTGARDGKIEALLKESKGHVKTAVLMAKRNFPYQEATRALEKSEGSLRKALSSRNP